MTLQKWGGIAALIDAATYVFGFVLLFTLLAPSGYGSEDAASSQVVAFTAENSGLMYVWNLSIYIINSIFLAVLVVCLYTRLKDAAPALAMVSSAFGLIWAGLVLGSGMIANVAVGLVVSGFETKPEATVALWETLSAVEEGLGGGNEIAGGLWVLLLSIAAIRTDMIPSALCYLGMLIGLAGLLTVIPGLSDLGGAVFGLGFIGWFVWMGVFLLTGSERQLA